MTRLISLLLGLVTFMAVAAEPSLYNGYEKDRTMLRRTFLINSRTKPINASSPEACQAAARIFKNVKFTGLTRKRVLEILGDPKTISDYGIAADTKPDSPLIYRFDTGLGGRVYTLEFRGGVAVAMKLEGLD
jgi:hypothetical protein